MLYPTSSTKSSIPCNQQAYANATKKNNLTEKERKEKEKQRKRKEEDRKRMAEIKRKDKLREHEEMSMIELQKLLNGRREKEIKGNEKEILREVKKKIKQRREEIMSEHGDLNLDDPDYDNRLCFWVLHVRHMQQMLRVSHV